MALLSAIRSSVRIGSRVMLRSVQSRRGIFGAREISILLTQMFVIGTAKRLREHLMSAPLLIQTSGHQRKRVAPNSSNTPSPAARTTARFF